jgi:hypothetical protein
VVTKQQTLSVWTITPQIMWRCFCVKNVLVDVKDKWKRFIFENVLDEELSPIVKESWIRSKKWQVDPFQPYGHIKKIDMEQYKSLIEWAMPFMEGLYSIVKGSGFLVILCNEKGQLLKSIGDLETLSMAEKIGFVEGLIGANKAWEPIIYQTDPISFNNSLTKMNKNIQCKPQRLLREYRLLGFFIK